ncbi:MAG: diacylglycerol/lipid kinase family protein [Clostridium paraputrificum]
MTHVFIVNPFAGGGKSLKILNKIKEVCNKENIDYIVRFTKAPNDATKIAREYENLGGIIYSVGGDGTMNEVLNGIVGSKNLFGILPAGSGNDFHRVLMAMDEISPTIDIGKINDRYFINIACIGIDADVANNVTLMKKTKIPPSQIYNISILYTFFKYKYKNLEFNLNNSQIKDKFTLLAT